MSNPRLRKNLASLLASASLPPTALADLATLAAAQDPDIAKLRAELIHIFNLIDEKPSKTPADVAAMESLADSMDEAEALAAAASLPPGIVTSLPSLEVLNARRTNPLRARMPRTVSSRGILLDAHENPLTDLGALTDAFNNLKGLRSGQSVRLAHADWRSAYPDDRRLTDDPFINGDKMQAQEAIIASGGVCGPVAVDFTLPMFSTADRPLRDALPSYNAERGGVRYLLPAAFLSGAGGTSLWTAATDLNPGAATKPVVTLACGTVQETLVDAVPTRLKIGNMQGRYSPEQVANWTETALAYAARFAELNLLTHIATNSTAVSSAQLLGASRDFLATLDQAAAAYRYRTRIPRTQKLTLILPDWSKDLLRADLTRQGVHQDPGFNQLALSDAEIEGLLTARGVTAIWLLDAQPTVTGAMPQVSQQFTTQTPNSTLQAWPSQLTWWMFATGTFSFLDGGQLEFQAIRDSTLDGTNDYEVMIETFEAIAFRGLESLQITSTVKANGASAATIATANSVIY